VNLKKSGKNTLRRNQGSRYDPRPRRGKVGNAHPMAERRMHGREKKRPGVPKGDGPGFKIEAMGTTTPEGDAYGG